MQGFRSTASISIEEMTLTAEQEAVIIGHISFNIYHLSFQNKDRLVTHTQRRAGFRMLNDKCQMIYDQ